MEYELKIYDGDLPYIFISYSHKDTEQVEQIIHGLQQRGHRIWFDSGIYGGEQWPTYIARRLKQCSAFLLFLSQNYMDSQNCVREIHYALKQNRKILPIYLEQIELDDGLDMQLSYIQALQFTGEQDKQNFWKAIDRVAILKPCRDESADAAPADPQKVPPAAAPKKEFSSSVPEKTTTAAKQKKEYPASAPKKAPKPAPQRSIPKAHPKNMLMESLEEDLIKMKKSFAFNTGATRAAVQTITFLDSLKSVPKNAADASLRQDGSVRAWAVKKGIRCDLYIAGEGGVQAPKNSKNLFACMENLTRINFNNAFFTENATIMNAMFEWDENLTDLDLSGFDTSNVTDMTDMFGYCYRLKSLDLRSFDTSKVTKMGFMFSSCRELTELDLRSFDTSKVFDMGHMFNCCRNLKKIDLRSFDTSNVMFMSYMFEGCSLLEDLELRNFNTARVGFFQNFMDAGKTVYGCPWEELFSKG